MKTIPQTYWQQRRQSLNNLPKDTRTEWEHDYGRVVHSPSFRRLQAKTQIFGVGENDFYRTRLTHSLEVSQIGEGITKNLYRTIESTEKKEWLPHPVLMRTICLAHDLGHPPFGHGGEVALNRCMLKHGGFEGNGQTLRIITKLEKYSEGDCMNLTRRTILGILKYPATYKDIVNKDFYPQKKSKLSSNSVFVAKKFKPPKCYFDDEKQVLEWIIEDLNSYEKLNISKFEKRNKKHGKTLYKSLDASIMDLADAIAYGVHDLEDVIALKLIDRCRFENWFEEKNKDKLALKPLLKEHFGGCFETMVNQLYDNTNIRKKAFGLIIGYFINSIKLINSNYNEFDCPLLRYQVEFNSCEEKEVLKVLQKIVSELVINSPQVRQLEFNGQKIVTELFHAFATDPKRLLEPEEYNRFNNSQNKKRVICDFIAGMTDDYAMKRYRQLFIPDDGSIFDRL